MAKGDKWLSMLFSDEKKWNIVGQMVKHDVGMT